MPSLAKITIVGHLGRAPETKAVRNDSVTEFSVAVNNPRDKDAPAAWYRVSAWNKTGEACQKYLDKGSAVLVIGDLTVREYEKKTGGMAYSLDVRAESVTFLSFRDGEQQPAAPAQPQQPTRGAYPKPADDVPF